MGPRADGYYHSLVYRLLATLRSMHACMHTYIHACIPIVGHVEEHARARPESLERIGAPKGKGKGKGKGGGEGER